MFTELPSLPEGLVQGEYAVSDAQNFFQVTRTDHIKGGRQQSLKRS